MTRDEQKWRGGVPPGSQKGHWRGPLRAAPGTLLDAWWPPSVPPLAYITPWGRNPKKRVLSAFLRRHGAETYRREKPSPAGRFRRGDHLPEGEIVSIIIIIVTSNIEIILNFIPNISTISIYIHLISQLQLVL